MGQVEVSQEMLSIDQGLQRTQARGTGLQERHRLGSLSLKNGSVRIEISKDDLPKCLNRANDAVRLGRIDQANRLLDGRVLETVQRILEKDHSRTDLMFVLAMLFHRTRRLQEAKHWYLRILQQEHNGVVYNELGTLCRQMGRLSEAIGYCREAIETDGDNAFLRANLAGALIAAGKVQQGLGLFREALKIEPANAAIHSSYLFYLHYLPRLDHQMIFNEHKKWGLIHAPSSLARTSHANNPDPKRSLRVGYISPDFCTHSTAYNFESLLDGHNRDAVETYGYGSVRMPDKTTQRLKTKFDHYRDIYAVDDEDAADMIEQDRIDILVDVGGHVADNRLRVLARKAAPIQVDYLGIDTTGMQAVDYFLTDNIFNPPQAQQFFAEELFFLPRLHFCYRPHEAAGAVEPLPAFRKGYVTFASFNNSCKLNHVITALWADVLKANRNSRLVLKFAGGLDKPMGEDYFRRFERLGIPRDRLAICGWKPAAEHFQMYGEVDIALDTYPFNGGITTLEGLWMGVPVVSLVGSSLVCRAGLGILRSIGLESFAASTPDEYVAKATALANNLEGLAKLRSSLRRRMQSSPLCDAEQLAGHIEAAYREMWRRWCRSQKAGSAVDGQAGWKKIYE